MPGSRSRKHADRPVAVFDIDGTLFRSGLTVELMEELVARGIFPPEAREVYADAHENWLNRKGDYEHFSTKIVHSFLKYAKGIPYGEVADVAGEIIESKRDRVYRYTRDLIKDLKKSGHYLLAISQSPKFIVDGFAYEHGFDKSYGTFMETGASGRFTGEIVDEHLINNKAAILQRVIEQEGLAVKDSYGVGDTDNDIGMLSFVETPIAFNPNRILYRHAKKHEWKIVVERKDVIYEI